MSDEGTKMRRHEALVQQRQNLALQLAEVDAELLALAGQMTATPWCSCRASLGICGGCARRGRTNPPAPARP